MRFPVMPLLLLCLVPSGCATPGYEYLGLPGQTVLRDGREFRVFLRRDGPVAQAQVIRLGWAGQRDHLPLLETMRSVAEEVSGCRAEPGMGQGDSGVLNLRLRCDG
jgi:hypothetical protein